MLGINTEYDVSLNAFNSELFHELTDDEASIFTGGLNLINDTERPITFYILSFNANPKRVVLQPGKEGSYNAANVLYDSIVGDPYKPKVEELDNAGSYSFSSTGDQISIRGYSASSVRT
ncbi:hypothetical protein PN450_06115 [Dolichospermum lemmermannii CS-548]|uniref:hypothetical protein n=1 Tax=Dolichospermum lemmermannii TaxID=54295 RepID=UPI00232E556D|nr:hypothetical protein [Dolichospermum lemmermannii]MDB9436388.1 hypothetical protein [Dolichospermum lemmermannii CS-548]